MEIWIMKQLHHPNIIQLREVFYEYPRAYVVMEYCEGGQLFNVAAQNPKGLTEERVSKMML
jgi:serine/threonine protein kinase